MQNITTMNMVRLAIYNVIVIIIYYRLYNTLSVIFTH